MKQVFYIQDLNDPKFSYEGKLYSLVDKILIKEHLQISDIIILPYANTLKGFIFKKTLTYRICNIVYNYLERTQEIYLDLL